MTQEIIATEGKITFEQVDLIKSLLEDKRGFKILNSEDDTAFISVVYCTNTDCHSLFIKGEFFNVGFNFIREEVRYFATHIKIINVRINVNSLS